MQQSENILKATIYKKFWISRTHKWFLVEFSSCLYQIFFCERLVYSPIAVKFILLVAETGIGLHVTANHS